MDTYETHKAVERAQASGKRRLAAYDGEEGSGRV